jgi:4-amino-4-deoxy-L-arabinose transferase-like glycosyltransferase
VSTSAAAPRRPAAARLGRWRTRATTLLRDPMAPVVVLSLIIVLSMFARVWDLGVPCAKRCHGPQAHTLIFDEAYYVNAARVIDGINPPAGAPYHDAPRGKDPNAEHPQLAKLVMAGMIKLFGDTPRGWRLGSVLFGLIALYAIYHLVLAAGGSRWLGVGAAAVMASDNLLLVHGRIGTLDIFAVALMLVAATLYLRRRPLAAGVALGVAACMKEVAVYLLFALMLLELIRIGRARWLLGERSVWVREHLRPLLLSSVATAVSAMALLWLLDLLVPGYDTGTHVTYGGDPFAHAVHFYRYSLLLKGTPNSTGISSSPFDWLLDQKPIDYARVAVNTLNAGKVVASRPIILFKGEMNPFIIFLAVPALFAAVAAAWHEADELALTGAAWCLGTYLPFVGQSELSGRVTYLYYMVIVMPGVYLVLARLFARRSLPLAVTVGWALMLLYGLGHLYPLRNVVLL